MISLHLSMFVTSHKYYRVLYHIYPHVRMCVYISIGAYFEPISLLYPAKRIGPFGVEGGSFWCDENSTEVRQVKVLSDKAGIVRVYGLYEKNGRIFWSSGHALDTSSPWHVDTVS